jgi:serine/threonine protein kinase
MATFDIYCIVHGHPVFILIFGRCWKFSPKGSRQLTRKASFLIFGKHRDFRRELVLGRQVSHPNVVRIHDIGQDGDIYFLTMDLVEGRSLRELILAHLDLGLIHYTRSQPFQGSAPIRSTY